MRFLDRILFRDTRQWVCGQATGSVLEVGVGTGLNLAHYPAGVDVVGVDLSPAMVALARERARETGRAAQLRVANAEALDLPDASFDTVVGTFVLCSVADHRRAIAEMVRVLRPGGTLLLADHVVAAPAPLRALQRCAEALTVPLMGEHFRRRPLDEVVAQGLRVERHERFAAGVVERLAARTPSDRP
jgi:ubiquinone/menaquinone biosynthesis C-methylase UbiE